MITVALSSWTWLVVAAFAMLSIGLLIRVTLGLIARLKDLNKTLGEAQAQVDDALGAMRQELDEATEHLAAMRERREADTGEVR